TGIVGRRDAVAHHQQVVVDVLALGAVLRRCRREGERASLHLLAAARTKSEPRILESETALSPIIGVHPAVIKIAISAAVWFLAVAWLDFSGGPEVNINLAVVTGFFVMFFTLFLMAASMVIDDPRWKQPKARFVESPRTEFPSTGDHLL